MFALKILFFEFSGMVAVQLSMFLFAVSLRQLVYYISLAVACQQLFYFSFSRISTLLSNLISFLGNKIAPTPAINAGNENT